MHNMMTDDIVWTPIHVVVGGQICTLVEAHATPSAVEYAHS